MAQESDQSFNPGDLSIEDENIDPNVRLERLINIYMDISEAGEDGALQPATVRHLQNGGSLMSCLSEIIELAGPSPHDLRIKELRQEFVQTQFGKSKLLTPAQRAAYDLESDSLESQYIEAVIAKIASFVEARTPVEALELRQLPPLVRKVSFTDGQPISMEKFTANHLYLLVDIALKEHVQRRRIIDEPQDTNLRARLASSLGTRIVIGSAIGAASLVPELGFVAKTDEALTYDTGLALKGLSGLIIGVNLPEYVRLKYLAERNDRRTEEDYDRLSDRRDICDWAMRIVYGSSRHGGSSEASAVTGRSGTDDKEENMRRLMGLQEVFPYLNNDPGGKPYTARQALGYAARLLLERKDQLFGTINPAKSADEQRRLYLELCREIMGEDVRRMKKGLNVTKVRRVAMGGIGLLTSMLLPGEVAVTSEAASLGKDTVDLILRRKSAESEAND